MAKLDKQVKANAPVFSGRLGGGGVISGLAPTAPAPGLGAWTATANSLSAGDATLHADGWIEIGRDDNVVRLDATHPDHRIWVGNKDPLLATFKVTKEGAMEATAGSIAGWEIAAQSLSNNDATLHSSGYLQLGTGNHIVRADAQHADYRLWVGHINPASAPFSVDKEGTLTASGAIIYGTLYADAGNIAGWEIFPEVIRKLVSNKGISLNSATQTIQVGDVTGPHIALNGAAGHVGVSNFHSGVSGWRVGYEGDAEFNNITARGVIRTPVFLKDEVTSIGGTFLVSASDVLIADVTTPAIAGHFTIDTEHDYFNVNDRLRCKPGPAKHFWCTVTGKAAIPGGWRYNVQLNTGSSEHTDFFIGEAVINYGVTGAGQIQMTATLANAPYISVFTHGGSPWLTITERVRLGKLDGITDPVFGALSGFGLWTDRGFFTGAISAGSGNIAGWDINVASFSKLDAVLHSAGYLSLGSGNNIARLDAQDATWRLWIGHATSTSAPFRVDRLGNLHAYSATIEGTANLIAGSLENLDIEGVLTIDPAGEIYSPGQYFIDEEGIRQSTNDGIFGFRNTVDNRVTYDNLGALCSKQALIGGDLTTRTTLSAHGNAGYPHAAVSFEAKAAGGGLWWYMDLRAKSASDDFAIFRSPDGGATWDGLFRVTPVGVYVKGVMQIAGGNPDAGKVLTASDVHGSAAWQTPAGIGEVNTASNVGSAGTGVYKQKVGTNLEFYKIASANNRMAVSLHGTDYLKLEIAEWNINHNALANTHNLTTHIDHNAITNTHNLTTHINHNALLNYVSNQHINWTSTTSNFWTSGSGYFGNSLRINDQPLYLRGSTDTNHYIRFMSADDFTRLASWTGWEFYSTQDSAVAARIYRQGGMMITDNFRYDGHLTSRKDSVDHTVYAFKPLEVFARRATPWNTSYTTAQAFWIYVDEFYINGTTDYLPEDIKALDVQVIFQSATVGNAVQLGPDDTYYYAMDVKIQVANVYIEDRGLVPVKDGRIRFRTSGANCNNIYIRVWGYYI